MYVYITFNPTGHWCAAVYMIYLRIRCMKCNRRHRLLPIPKTDSGERGREERPCFHIAPEGSLRVNGWTLGNRIYHGYHGIIIIIYRYIPRIVQRTLYIIHISPVHAGVHSRATVAQLKSKTFS